MSRDTWVCPECGWPISWIVYECPNCHFTVKDDEEMEPYRVQWFFPVQSSFQTPKVNQNE